MATSIRDGDISLNAAQLKFADLTSTEKRRVILENAANLFCSKGFNSTSIDEIAERLGVTKPTIYSHFGSKDEILFDCIRIGLDMINDAIDRVPDTSDASARLRAALTQFADVMTRDFGRCVTLTSEHDLQPESRRKLRNWKSRVDLRLRGLVYDGVVAGVFRDVDAKWMAFTLGGAINWIPRWFDPARPEKTREIVEAMVDTLLLGVILPQENAHSPSAARAEPTN